MKDLAQSSIIGLFKEHSCFFPDTTELFLFYISSSYFTVCFNFHEQSCCLKQLHYDQGNGQCQSIAKTDVATWEEF